MGVIWRNGNNSDLYLDVVLSTPGAGGGYGLESFDPNTGVYAAIGQRADNPPNPSQPVFRIPAAGLTANPLSLRLGVTIANPAGADMPVALRIRQAAALAPEDAGSGAALPYPAPLAPDAQQNTPQYYDLDVWFP